MMKKKRRLEIIKRMYLMKNAPNKMKKAQFKRKRANLIGMILKNALSAEKS